MSNDFLKRRSHRLDREIYSSTQLEFFFTLCARHHHNPFDNAPLAESVVQSLMWTREQYGWRLFCYCLMPDHLHFLCRLTDKDVIAMNGGVHGEIDVGVLEHVARFKSYSTIVSWKYGLEGPLWQKSSYDRVMDLQRPFEEVAQYTLQNPERKGLVQRWEEWPYARIVDKW